MIKNTQLLALVLLAFSVLAASGCSKFHAPNSPPGEAEPQAQEIPETSASEAAPSEIAPAEETAPAAESTAGNASSGTDAAGQQAASPPPGPFLQMAPTAPPAPLLEMKPILQDPQRMAWRPGHWSYSNTQFSWVPGEVMEKPSPSAVWSPDRWDKREYGWVYVPGTWQ